MRISDWSSDVCSSDLPPKKHWVDAGRAGQLIRRDNAGGRAGTDRHGGAIHRSNGMAERASAPLAHPIACRFFCEGSIVNVRHFQIPPRSEEHTSELQSLMRNSYHVLCLKKTKHPP